MTLLTLDDLLSRSEAPFGQAEVDRYRSEGLWSNRTLRSLLTDAAAEHPDRTAIVGHRTGRERETLTYRELDDAATRAANALASLGVGPGDAVAVMVPNCVEYPAIMFGTHELRAVYIGIPVSYGPLQALPIMQRSAAKVLVIPRGWRSLQHLDMVRSLRDRMPALETVIVLDEADDLADGEVLWRDLADAPAHGRKAGEPTDLCYLGFTSGTTGEPKGAMHTHETLIASMQKLAEHIGPNTFGDPMVQLVASPVGHHTGYVWCTLFTVLLRGTGVQVDRWEPQWGADLIRDEGITAFFGAPTFLQDLMRTDLANDPACPLECVLLAGSPVPRTLPAAASAALGAYIAPAWGMTECSINIACTPAEPHGILATDGSVFEGSQARVVDDNDEPLPSGSIGELQVKGPSVFVGYFERPDATAASFTADGWFRTGDTADIDEHGWVALRGRKKDIIIRGGENIPVTEVETVLFDHPDVLNVAIVGYPDERLGERACAVVVFKPGAERHELAALCSYLIEAGVSKHFLPERLLVLDELPMTQSGKIQKFALRDLVAAGV